MQTHLDPVFGSYELAVRFHPYQQTALDTLMGCVAAGEQRLHLVAPPGAGKTLLGLEMIRRLGQRAVILSPTTAIQYQWLQQFETLSVNLDSHPSFESEAQTIISTDPAQAPPILSLTYQRVSQSDAGELKATVQQLFTQLAAQGYRTLVLDECHHLLSQWAQAIAQFGAELEDAILLGLTATPPVDRKDREKARLLSLVGEVNYEISQPAVIREGHLAPFQDLVYLVRPTESESQFISGAHQQLQALLESLEQGSDPGADHRTENSPGLALWAESWLLMPQDPQGRPLQRQRVLLERPDLALACLRFLNQQGIYPAEAPWSPEVDDPLELEDRILLAGCYWQEHALADQLSHFKQLIQQLGYEFRQGRIWPRLGQVDRVLAMSAAKLRALEPILSQEMACMAEALRVLILTDYETTVAPGKRAALEGVLDPAAGGAVGVMRYLCADPRLRALKPVLATGKTLMCTPELQADFEKALAEWQQAGLKLSLAFEPLDSFLRIKGKGADWNPRRYLALVTQMLEQGHSQCLIGTRGLLGEGWNCLALNTLIDLTSVSSFVAVNQIRGRCLRRDPQSPEKVAHIWDLVALAPELNGGLKDLQRLQQKHLHFYGLTDDGKLEKGLGRVHPFFERGHQQQLLASLDGLNREMLQRTQQRSVAYRQWRVGRPYHNLELCSLQISAEPGTLAAHNPQRRQQALPQRLPQTLPRQLALDWQQLQSKRRWLPVPLWLGSSASGLLYWQGLATLWGLGFGVAVSLLVWLGWGLQLRRYQPAPPESQAFLKALATTCLDALQACGFLSASLNAQALSFSQRSDGSLRISLQTSSSLESSCFFDALQETLGPVQEQRYLLAFESCEWQESKGWAGFPQFRPGQPQARILPLPRVLARSRQKAQTFLAAFEARIGPAELIYTRQGAGKAQLSTYLHQRLADCKTQQIQIWE